MALTLIPATAASTDTGWTQLYSSEWEAPTLTLTLVGTGTAFVEARGKRTGGDTPLFAGEITWTASGSQAITLPTFVGKVRVSVRILSTSGSIAVSISDPTNGSSYDPATGNTTFGGAVAAAGDGGIQGAFLGTFEDEASLPATATPGALATTRDGKSYVFAAVV